MRLALAGTLLCLLAGPSLAATSPECVTPDLAVARAKAYLTAINRGGVARVDLDATGSGTLTILIQGIAEPVVVTFKDGCLVEPETSKYGPPKVRV